MRSDDPLADFVAARRQLAEALMATREWRALERFVAWLARRLS